MIKVNSCSSRLNHFHQENNKYGEESICDLWKSAKKVTKGAIKKTQFTTEFANDRSEFIVKVHEDSSSP